MIFVSSALLLLACTDTKEARADYAVSVAPLKYLVRQVVGDSADVLVLVPRGVSPETFEPTPSMIRQLHHAKYFIDIEGIMPIRKYNISVPDRIVFGNIRQDPHLWMSPLRMLAMADTLRNRIANADAHSDPQLAASPNMPTRIAAVHDSLTRILAPIRGSAFVIYHPVLTYFAKDYGLEQLAIESEGKEPTPASIRQLIREAQQKHAKVMLVSEERDSRAARKVADMLNIPTVTIDPLTEQWDTEILRIAYILRSYY